jgi:hypothetical protein
MDEQGLKKRKSTLVCDTEDSFKKQKIVDGIDRSATNGNVENEEISPEVKTEKKRKQEKKALQENKVKEKKKSTKKEKSEYQSKEEKQNEEPCNNEIPSPKSSPKKKSQEDFDDHKSPKKKKSKKKLSEEVLSNEIDENGEHSDKSVPKGQMRKGNLDMKFCLVTLVYKSNEQVWAKMRTFPWWPAKVSIN